MIVHDKTSNLPTDQLSCGAYSDPGKRHKNEDAFTILRWGGTGSPAIYTEGCSAIVGGAESRKGTNSGVGGRAVNRGGGVGRKAANSGGGVGRRAANSGGGVGRRAANSGVGGSGVSEGQGAFGGEGAFGWLTAVADGLGGHPRGAEASALAIDAVEAFEPGDSRCATDADLIGVFRAAFDKVEGLRSHSRSLHPSNSRYELYQPATTLTVATGTTAGDVKIANLGDSRAYVISADGDLLFASVPHNHDGGYVAKCIGGYDYMVPDITTVKLPKNPAGVIVVGATDGTWVPLTRFDEDTTFVYHVMKACKSVKGDGQRLAQRLTDDAVSAGGSGTDNATVSVVIL